MINLLWHEFYKKMKNWPCTAQSYLKKRYFYKGEEKEDLEKRLTEMVDSWMQEVYHKEENKMMKNG